MAIFGASAISPNGFFTLLTPEISCVNLPGKAIKQVFVHMALFMGQWISPRSLGWDWKVASAVVASFPAREVVVGTLGVLYNVGDDADENSESLRDRLKSAKWDGTDRKVFNLPMALGLMVFFALCAQCVSTLAIMVRETGGYRWPAFTFAYMTVLAWVGAFLVYQIGMRITGG